MPATLAAPGAPVPAASASSTPAPADALQPVVDASRTVGVLGVGVMGQALIRALVRGGVVAREQVWGAARSAATSDRLADALGVPVETRYRDRVEHAGLILLCVKPTQIDAVLDTLRSAALAPDTLIISIAAGTTIAHIESRLGTANPVIRAMPNTPCVVGAGMTVICGGTHANASHLERAHRVFAAVGRCVTLDETYFDSVTGLSASGPAYLYLVMEALADGGVRMGLRRDVALMLVAQTVAGAAKMVQETGRHPAALRDDVTTPAGCTIGGLLILEDGKIRSVLARAVEEATRIAGKLGTSPSPTPTSDSSPARTAAP